MNSQAGIQSSRKTPASMPPVAKLIHARHANMTTIEPLQTISNVFMQIIYDKTEAAKMGFIPYKVGSSPNQFNQHPPVQPSQRGFPGGSMCSPGSKCYLVLSLTA